MGGRRLSVSGMVGSVGKKNRTSIHTMYYEGLGREVTPGRYRLNLAGGQCCDCR